MSLPYTLTIKEEITEDTPELYADLMKRCWDSNPENRPDAKEIEKRP